MVGCVMPDLTCSPFFAELPRLLEDPFPAEVLVPGVQIKNRLWMMPALAYSGLAFVAQAAQKQRKVTCSISR